LQKELANLYLPQVQRLPVDREQMLEHQAVLLWDTGSDLLERGIKLVFEEGKKTGAEINPDFWRAMATSAQEREFRPFSPISLSQKKVDKLPSRFVSEVWGHFIGRESPFTDIGEFMRLVIGRLPEAVFKKLEADLKTSEDKKAPFLSALDAYFEAPINLVSLKGWACG